jgi:hypothetical protein
MKNYLIVCLFVLFGLFIATPLLAANLIYDLDSSGRVDFKDYAIVANEWGAGFGYGELAVFASEWLHESNGGTEWGEPPYPSYLTVAIFGNEEGFDGNYLLTIIDPCEPVWEWAITDPEPYSLTYYADCGYSNLLGLGTPDGVWFNGVDEATFTLLFVGEQGEGAASVEVVSE